jgi:iron-sulfur cluster insertion protein
MNLTITETASSKIADILAEEGQNTTTRVRVFVQGGGCSGMQYGFTLDDSKNEDDFEVPAGLLSVLVDSVSMQYLENASIDYVEDLTGSQFKISNPQAQTTCGCGSSFNPY